MPPNLNSTLVFEWKDGTYQAGGASGPNQLCLFPTPAPRTDGDALPKPLWLSDDVATLQKQLQAVQVMYNELAISQHVARQ